MRKLYLFFFCIAAFVAQAQKAELQSGPMVGYSTMREVLLWVQTTAPAEVHFEYWEEGKQSDPQQTAKVQTTAAQAYVAKIAVSPLEPGTTYQYALFIDEKEVKRSYPLRFQTQTLWQYRTDPPAFTFAFGSCAFVNEEIYDRPGDGYGGEYEIFTSIAEKKPDFMVWGGDNMYLREADWNSRTGIIHRFTHTRSLEEMQPLLGSTHHYATWDDHDFGPNNSDRSFPQKHLTEEVFNLFWGNLNTNLTGEGGVTSHFAWQDCEFFMLDNRYFRSPQFRKTGQRQMLGEKQMQWLIDALVNSRAPFKFVVMGGQAVSDYAYYENYATFPEERARLLSLIEQENIPGVIFLTGDRHHTILSKMERPASYPLYDLTCSSLTAGAHPPREDENTYRVKGTEVGVRNFSILSVSGPRKDRVLNIEVFDAKGKSLWTHEIKATDLQTKRR